MAELRAPLFLIGVGRSGSTVFQRLLGLHPRISWLSGLAERYPDRPAWNRALGRALEWPLVGEGLRRRFRPGECWGFWESLRPGFRRPFRDLVAADVTPRDRRRIPAALTAMMPPSRPHPLVKLTGWPRIGFLREIFPEARFVHLIRDGRAVAASLTEVGFWRGWQGPGGWRWGPLPPAYQELWESTGSSFHALAGLQWRRIVEVTAEAARALPPDRFLEVRYEDLCDRPRDTVDEILAFAGIGPSSRFHRRLETFPLESANDKWRRRLTADQQAALETVLVEPLAAYGYRGE